MSPRVANHRRVICQGCPTPCAPYQTGQIDHEDHKTACPLGVWHARPLLVDQAVSGLVPSLWTKLKNVSRSFLHWRQSGYPKRTKAEIKACLAICASCKHWNAPGNLGLGECRHPRCGCTRFKPQWRTEHCPMGLW